VKYHEHDLLLQHMEEESLTDEEKAAAWAEYKAEREGHKRLAAAESIGRDLSVTSPQLIAFMGVEPEIAQWMTFGNKLVRENDDGVKESLEQICEKWLRDDPESVADAAALLRKLKDLVRQLKNSAQGPVAQVPVAQVVAVKQEAKPRVPSTSASTGTSKADTHVSSLSALYSRMWRDKFPPFVPKCESKKEGDL